MRLIVSSLILLLALGCSTRGYVVNDLEYSLKSIQKAVAESMPNGLDLVSANRREFRSKYFPPYQLYKKGRRPKKRVRRAKAHVFILGDMRPYDVKIVIYVDQRVSGGPPAKRVYSESDLKKGSWEERDRSEKLAKRIGDSISEYLSRASREKNLIDDFRPF